MRRVSFFGAVALTAGLGNAQVFERLITSPFVPVPPFGSSAIAVADFDGDGRVDVLMYVHGGPLGGLGIYRQQPDSRFVHAQQVPGGTGFGNTFAADFDGDGDLDLSSGTEFWRNDQGVLTQVDPGLPTSLFPGPSVGADLDGDGDAELLIVLGQLRVFDLDAGGTFVDRTSTTLSTPLSGSALLSLDAERDGDTDFVLLNGGFQLLSVGLLRNDGAGHLTLEDLPVPSVLSVGTRLWVGDLDADGDTDVLLMSLLTQLSALFNDGAGAFTLQTVTPAPPFSFLDACTLGDWLQTGGAQLIGPGGILPVLPGDPTVPFPLGSVLNRPLLADLDGDLDLDAVSGATIVYNTGGGAQPGCLTPVIGAAPPYLGQFDSFSRRDERVAAIVLAPGDTYAFAAVPNFFQLGYQPLVATPIGFGDAPYDAALYGQYGPFIVMCGSNGPHLAPVSGAPPVDAWPLTGLQIGAPTHVAVGDVIGNDAVEFVFGDPTVAGPRIVTQDAAGAYSEQVVALPPATPVSQAFETVLVADMDGDGDLDVVHELRVLLNDGNGQWSVGAQLADLVHPATQRMLTIDFDSDGDLDLITFGSYATTLLLRNDGGTFHDATIGHLPSAEWAATSACSVGDVDGDGDDDLLTVRNGQSNLLRNDGGVFVRFANVGPPGALLDTDFDGRADLFTGGDVWKNRHTLLHERHRPAPGLAWTLEVHTWRPAALPQLAVVAIGGYSILPVDLPGIGRLEIDPNLADFFPVPLSVGRGELTFPIPLTPTVVGIELLAQAVTVEPSRLTLSGAVRDRVR